jgi:hypothetical protein
MIPPVHWQDRTLSLSGNRLKRAALPGCPLSSLRQRASWTELSFCKRIATEIPLSSLSSTRMACPAVFVGAGFCPRRSSPEKLSHMMMEQQADRGDRFLLVSVPNSKESLLPVLDLLFFMQESILLKRIGNGWNCGKASASETTL